MTSTFLDLRNAARSLRRSPTIALSAVLCLALGIGATTAISSAIRRALFQPPPFREPERLVAVHRITPQSGPQGTWPQSVANYIDLAQGTRLVQGLAALAQGTALVQLPNDAIQASLITATGNLFSTLGVPAAIGRFMSVDDDRLDAPLVAVLGYDFWRTRLGGDSAIVGRTMTMDGRPVTIVGVAPADLRIPHGGNVLRADVWMPIRFTPANRASRGSNYLQVLGRLAPGATVEQGHAEMRKLFGDLVAAFPQLKGEDVRVAPLQKENTQSIRRPLVLLFGAVCMVLLIAATNVAAMLLARGVQRRREFAVRTALGATRWDAMRPALAESFLISGLGVVLGVALAIAGVRTIGTLAAARMRQLAGLHVDVAVIGFALALALIVAVVCGAVPAWRGASVDPQDALRSGRGGGAGREHQRALSSLVVVEIALSLVLLIGAGLVLKGFAGLLRNDPGFETAHVLTMRVTVSATRYPDQTSVRNFLEPALQKLREVPGVQAVGSINLIPYVNWGWNGNTRYEGQPADEPTRYPITEARTVSPDFFTVTGQRLLAGRLLRASDDESPGAPPVVVVNQALVDRDFKGRDPIGQRFYVTDSLLGTIVGVVSNIRNMGPITPTAPEMYWTYRQSALGSTEFPFLVRVRGGDPARLAGPLTGVIRGIDPTAAVGDVRPMTDVISRSLGRPRFYFSLLGTFAAVALVLAVAGLYGVLSYAVAQRTREIGIRAALGSPRISLMRLVTMQGLRLVLVGLALGIVGGLAVTKLMVFMLYGVSPLDVPTWVLSSLLMLTVAMLAAAVPALRAARVDPLIAIQAE